MGNRYRAWASARSDQSPPFLIYGEGRAHRDPARRVRAVRARIVHETVAPPVVGGPNCSVTATRSTQPRAVSGRVSGHQPSTAANRAPPPSQLRAESTPGRDPGARDRVT